MSEEKLDAFANREEAGKEEPGSENAPGKEAERMEAAESETNAGPDKNGEETRKPSPNEPPAEGLKDEGKEQAEEKKEGEAKENPETEQQADEGETAKAEGEAEKLHREKEQLEQQIDELKRELEEKDNRYLRLYADFENYKRRTRNEIEAIKKYQAQDLIADLLPAIDNFERALKSEAKSDDAKNILKGIEMVYRGMMEALAKAGVKPIEAVGQAFDPRYHHAVMQEKSEDHPSNVVLEEFQKGYMLKDRVIRPSMVKVSE